MFVVKVRRQFCCSDYRDLKLDFLLYQSFTKRTVLPFILKSASISNLYLLLELNHHF